MITRVAWLLIDPCDSRIFTNIVEGAEADQFSSDTTSGFLIDTLRRDYVEGRFVEKTETTETVLDPFGNPIRRRRVDYEQLRFRLQKQAPHLEIYNAPRNLNAFLNRLGEFTKGAVAIYSPDVSISAWLDVLAVDAKSLIVHALLIADLAVGEKVSAKIALSGSEDVRNYVEHVTQGKKHRLVQAMVSARFSAGDARVTIRPLARVVVASSEDRLVAILRDSFKRALTKR